MDHKKLNHLSAEQRSRLAGRLLKKRLERDPRVVLPRRRNLRQAPVSWAQKRLLTLQQLYPHLGLNHLAVLVHFQGEFDQRLLCKAFEMIVERHASFRTTFVKNENGWIQKIHPAAPFHIRTVDSTSQPLSRAQFKSLLDKEIQRPFSLENGPLFRMTLYQSGHKNRLLLVMHHLITDGWSMSVLLSDLSAVYSALVGYGKGGVGPPPLDYGDYTIWQQEMMNSNKWQTQQDFWLDILRDAPQMLDIPTDYKVPIKRTYAAGHFCFTLFNSLVDDLKKAARRHGGTLYMMLMAAFAYLIYRYSDQYDFTIGTPVAQRNRRQFNSIIGFFINILVLRFKIDPQKYVSDWIAEVRAICLSAFDNQDLPFDWLLEKIKPARMVNRSPLFQVLFVLQNMPRAESELPGLDVSMEVLDSHVTAYDLTVVCNENPGGLEVHVEYGAELFMPGTIRAMMESFEHILKVFAGGSNPVLADVDCVPNDHFLTAGRQGIDISMMPYRKTIDQLFRERVCLQPRHTALRWPGGRLSYEQLDHQSDDLAGSIRAALKPNPQTALGVLMPKSPLAVVSILAVFKAGCVYVPLDMDYPSERLQFMVSQGRCAAVLCTDSSEKSARMLSGPCIKRVDQLPAAHNHPLPSGSPLDPAYLIFTSGSTGIPKAVQLAHEGFVCMARDMIDILKVSAHDRFLQFARFGFDGSLFEIFVTLFAGAALVIPAHNPLLDPGDFGQFCSNQGVTIAVLPPAFIRMTGFSRLKCLKKLITAGEEALPDNGRFIDRDHSYWNLYGPTEASVTATCYRIPGGETGRRRIPIGRAIPHTRVDIFQVNGVQQQPVGAIGEICLSGITLANGYLDRPDLTAEVFVPHPSHPKKIMYRTGDLGRRLPDGNIEFLGRKDEQIKRYGYRIEPGEIEKQLAKIPGIKRAIVIYDKQKQELVAGIAGRVKNTFALQNQLRRFLPVYMLPSRYSLFKTLPLTLHNKIDRKKIMQAAKPPRGGADSVKPQSEKEKMLYDVWKKLLNLGDFDIQSSFFHLGGDSIKAIMMLSELQKRGWTFNVADIYSHDRIASLAPLLKVFKKQPSVPAYEEKCIPLTPVQQWFFDTVRVDRHHFLQTLMLESTERIELGLFRKISRELVRRHDSFRLRFTINGGIKQVLSHDDQVFIHESSFMGEKDRFQADNCIQHLMDEINVEKGPLVIFALQHLRQSDRIIFLYHHLVIDMYSMRLIAEEFVTLYQQFKNAEWEWSAAGMNSFVQWAFALKNYACQPSVRDQIPYWQRLHSDIEPLLPIKANAAKNERAGRRSLQVFCSREINNAFKYVPGLYVVEYLLASLCEVLFVWLGKKTAVIDVVSHGRNMNTLGTDCSRTTGWFSGFHPFRLKRGVNDRQTLKNIKLEMQKVPDAGLGYMVLRFITRDLATGPHSDISFNYIGRIRQNILHPSFRVSTETIKNTMSDRQQPYQEQEITAMIINDRLLLHTSYNPHRIDADMMEFFHCWKKTLQKLVTFSVDKP